MRWGPLHQPIRLTLTVVRDEAYGRKPERAPEVDTSWIGQIGINGEPLPSEVTRDEPDQRLNDSGPQPTSTLGRAQDEIHPSARPSVIGDVVLNEPDGSPAFLDDEAFDARASRAEVLRTDLRIGHGRTSPPLVNARIAEQRPQRSEVVTHRGTKNNPIPFDCRVSHATSIARRRPARSADMPVCDSALTWSYHGRTMSSMSTVVKRSISLPADVFEALEAQAAEEGRTVSAALADAADLWLATRRGLRAVRAWEREHGGLTAEELAAADRELDRAGVGRG